ncbi:maturase K [Gossypium australe]|uniref:Maturase K n=1 Tax=Gossypium australe TaxID=47621 RepID=A0A5B6WHH3_9ROSI|nr:maturase K [Gossypium australe]
MDPDRAVADNIESNKPAHAQGTAPAESRPIASCHEGEAKQAFFQMMSEWFSDCSTTSTPESTLVPQKTLIYVVPRERITWDFFQVEFRKKYISQRFIDQKRKEFLKLK